MVHQRPSSPVAHPAQPALAEALVRQQLRVYGVVQGVGFRPFIYRLAIDESLAGFIGNDTDGVTIEIEGNPAGVAAFRSRLRGEAPPLSRIDSVTERALPPIGESGFRIVASEVLGRVSTGIPADAATCADCLRELLTPTDRRFRYPFLNCTNCGPRFTITRQIPYDRPQTSMAMFPMCPACQREYDDPLNRRFHAQPNACWDCGPRVWLCGADGVEIPAADPVASTIDRILAGEIMAIKGIGGFHLCVDATSESAVMRLRQRKRRFGKPLAVMVRDLAAARAICEITNAEASLLSTPARPIVLARARQDSGIAPSVAPGIPWLGIFLPYAPLQHLLFADPRVRALVMTSANLSEEPIAIDNDEARVRLANIADAFLMHNREILQRCDDSVTAIVDGAPQLIRRARGYVPLALSLPIDSPPLLAVGGQLKSVFALARGRHAYQSQHLGDLESLTALDFFKESLDHLMRTFEIEPQALIHDLHPGYMSTAWAKESAAARGLRTIAVQHHHAHVAACMAEHNLAGPVVGLSLDGTGYGTDGRIWGGEVLICSYKGFERFAHLDYVPMPGSEAAIREPWRMAFSHLLAAGFDVESREILSLLDEAGEGDDESGHDLAEGSVEQSSLDGMVSSRPVESGHGFSRAEKGQKGYRALAPAGVQSAQTAQSFHRERSTSFNQVRVIRRMIDRNLNSPLTSSGGRLFDAAAAIILGRHAVDYEAQAAIELEGLAIDEPDDLPPYELEITSGDWPARTPATILAAPMWRRLIGDLRSGTPPPRIAARFHSGVAHAFSQAAVLARVATCINQVALSGGCLHNRRLARLLRRELEREGFEVFAHRSVSPGDGGLSYGQAVIGAAILTT